ncbi:hypothetical protein [Candidatus Vidania fulgoroideorum]
MNYEIVFIFNKINFYKFFIKKINKCFKNFYSRNFGYKKLSYKIKNNIFGYFAKVIINCNYKELENFIIILKNNSIRFLVIKKKIFFIKKNNENFIKLNYLNRKLMNCFIDDNCKIIPRKLTGYTIKDQKKISNFVKISRYFSIIPYKIK